MSETKFAEFVQSIMQNMSLHILSMASGEGPKEFLTRDSGDLMHLRVRDGKGGILFQVSGKDTDALAFQLLLACLQKITTQQLRSLHKTPLKAPISIAKVAPTP